jgi:hypothetical protein
MFDYVKKAVELFDKNGRFFQKPNNEHHVAVHPLDDPQVWLSTPCYEPPANVNIENAQKWINSIIGTTRDNQPICKLVWNGDRSYWYEFFMQWNNIGQPTAGVVPRPRIRYKIKRDPATGQFLSDVFPPRWVLLFRLEPEQYADGWKKESYVWAPEINCFKQIRPDEPPKVFWLWFATLAEHSDYCCATAAKVPAKCYGKYVEPYFAQDLLEIQGAAMQAEGTRNPYAKIGRDFIRLAEDENNGYRFELQELKIESEIYAENPYALLGIHASLKAGIENEKQAKQMVKEFYDREIQTVAAKAATKQENLV